MSRIHARLVLNQLERRDVPAGWLATAADAGGGPHVIIRTDTNSDGKADTIASSFFAFNPNFRGGVRVATGDFDGDGHDELVTAAGPGGGPHIKIWNVDTQGHVMGLREEFFAFDPSFRGGSWVTTGNFDSNHRAELIVGAGEGGGPHVRAFSDSDHDGRVGDNLRSEFFAFDPAFRGGVRVANQPDGLDLGHLLVAAGPGGQPLIQVYNRLSNAGIECQFLAFDAGYSGGVFVAASDNFLYAGGNKQVAVFHRRWSEVNLPQGVPPRPAPPIGTISIGGYYNYSLVTTLDFGVATWRGGARVNVSSFSHPGYYSNLVVSYGAGGLSRVSSFNVNIVDPWVYSPIAPLHKADEFFGFLAPDGSAYNVGVFTASGR